MDAIDAAPWAAELVDQIMGVTPARQRGEVALALAAASLAASARILGPEETVAQAARLLVAMHGGER